MDFQGGEQLLVRLLFADQVGFVRVAVGLNTLARSLAVQLPFLQCRPDLHSATQIGTSSS